MCEDIAVTAVQDVLAVVAHSARALKCTSFEIAAGGIQGDSGDANEQLLNIRIRSGQTTVGSGGAAVTPVRTGITDAAAGFTARRNDTTQASAGTIVVHHASAWNPRTSWIWVPPEKAIIELVGGRRLTFALTEAPITALAVSATMYLEEVG